MNAVRTHAGPKVLRVGVIRDGRIVEERTLGVDSTLSVGSSEKSDVLLSAPGISGRFTLIDKGRQGYMLHVPTGATGRLTTSAGAVLLEGEARTVVLDERSRGRVVIGDTTLLFQFVSAPPTAQRPQLPAAARGGVVGSIDWLFTTFIVFSYMTFFGFVVYLENADWQLDQDIALVSEIAARLVFTEPTPPPERPVPDRAVDEAQPEPEQVADAEPSHRPRAESDGPTADPVRNAEQMARIQEAAAQSAEHLMLTALGANSAFRNVLDGGAAIENASDVLAMVSSVEFATRDSATLRDREGRSDGSGETRGLGLLLPVGPPGPTIPEGRELVERVPHGTIDMQRGIDTDGTGEMSGDTVTRAIRQHLRGLQRCYERQLPNDPSLAGKVVIDFTIQERGHVTGAHASENLTGSSPLAACLSGVIGRLRFNPAPVGGSVSFRYPFVFAPQN